MKITPLVALAVLSASLLAGCASCPDQSAAVAGSSEKTVYVLGRFVNQGSVSLQEPTFLRVMAIAAVDFGRADTRKITLRRNDENIAVVNLSEVLDSGKTDIVLEDGDVLYVPERVF